MYISTQSVFTCFLTIFELLECENHFIIFFLLLAD